jgi:hypothetical protein
MLSCCGSAMVIGLFVFPLFAFADWVALAYADSPDVPDPTSADQILGLVGMISVLPAGLMTDLIAPQALDSGAALFACAAIDALFWGFVMAITFRLLGRACRVRMKVE